MADDRFSAVLRAAGEILHVAVGDARPLRRHTWHTYLLPSEGLVVRLAAATAENLERARTALQVTSWLTAQGFPCVRPAQAEPLVIHGVTASVWHYLPQPETPGPLPMATLGRLLRELHALTPSPIDLPPHYSFSRLRRALDIDCERASPVLNMAERAFLDERITQLVAAYRDLEFPLGRGLIHNDAHPGNLLVDPSSPYGYVLADWDGVCHGPREIDLVQEGAPGNRFGLPAAQRQAFTAGYGYDIAEWSGWPVLRDIRDLYSIGAYVRVATEKPAAADELRRRLESLRSGDRGIRWRGVE